MFLEIKPDVYVNTDRILFCSLSDEDNSFAVQTETSGYPKSFIDVDTEKIRNFLKGRDNGRTEIE